MLNTIKIPVMFLALALLVFLPKVSYAWQDQYGRDDGRALHRHSFHSYANPDLTLVTGMDNIDSRVLIASGPDPSSVVIDQVVLQQPVIAPVQISEADTYGSFIVNVPNKAGGYNSVRIQKWGSGYMGPQGELYYPFPKVSQLKAIYRI